MSKPITLTQITERNGEDPILLIENALKPDLFEQHISWIAYDRVLENESDMQNQNVILRLAVHRLKMHIRLLQSGQEHMGATLRNTVIETELLTEALIASKIQSGVKDE